jgi:hypothetical protein
VSLEPAIITGAFGLGGVAVGAASTSWIEWKLFGRRERVDEDRREHERAVRVRQAARLVMEDFATISTHITVCLEAGDAIPPEARSAWQLPNWQAYQGVLALELDEYQLWRALAEAATSCLLAASTLSRFPVDAAVLASISGALRGFRADIDKTAGILASFASIDPT